jgi:hypothetical protein
MKRTDHQYKLRFPPELKARIEASAKENNRSMNAEIVEQLTAVYNIQSMLKDAPPEDELEQSPESRIRWQMSMLKMYANQIDLIRQEVEGYLSGSEEAAPTRALAGNVLLEKRGDSPSPTAKRPLRKQSRPLGMDQAEWEAKRLAEPAVEQASATATPTEPAQRPVRGIRRDKK